MTNTSKSHNQANIQIHMNIVNHLKNTGQPIRAFLVFWLYITRFPVLFFDGFYAFVVHRIKHFFGYPIKSGLVYWEFLSVSGCDMHI